MTRRQKRSVAKGGGVSLAARRCRVCRKPGVTVVAIGAGPRGRDVNWCCVDPCAIADGWPFLPGAAAPAAREAV